MSESDVDLERAASDPAYRRRVIHLINEEGGPPPADPEPRVSGRVEPQTKRARQTIRKEAG